MRWTRQRQARRSNGARTNDADADGEVVWSWRSDAGAKVAESSANDGGNQAWSPRRARRKPLKPFAQGMPAVAVCPWLLTRVLFLRTRGLGCNAHPAFPAPSSRDLNSTPRAQSRREPAGLFPKPLFEN